MKLHPKIVYIIFFLYGNAHCSHHNTSVSKKILAEIIDFKQSLTKKDFFYLSLIAFVLHKIFKIEKHQNKKIENLEKEQKKINKKNNQYIRIFQNNLYTVLKKFKQYLRLDQYEQNLQNQKKINDEQKQINTNEILARTELEKSILIIVEMLTQCKNQYNIIQKLIEIVNQSLNQKYQEIQSMYKNTQEINKENQTISEENQTINKQQNQLQNEIKIELQKLENFIINFYRMNIQFKKQQQKASGDYLEAHGLFNKMLEERKISEQSLKQANQTTENFLQFIQKTEKNINDQHQYLNQFCQTLRCTLNKIQKNNKSNYDASSLMSSSRIENNNNFLNQTLTSSQFKLLSHSHIITRSSNQKI
jgi:DNA-binding Xre family transcriptional regulator